MLTPGLKATFFQAFVALKMADWGRITTVIPSNKALETYGWLGAIPGMREFFGERVLNGLSEYNYSLTNRKWESSIGVDVDAIDDDQYGQVKIQIMQLADAAAAFVNLIMFQTLAGGFTNLCYDGQYFFDTDHVSGASGTQSNRYTAALSMTSYDAMKLGMGKIKNDQGDPMGIKPDLLIVPLDLETLALEITKSTIIPIHVGDGTAGSGATAATGYTNVRAGQMDVLATPLLTDTTNWFMADTKGAVKGLIWQARQEVQFDALERQSEMGFMRDQFAYGVKMRGAPGYGLWQKMGGSIQ